MGVKSSCCAAASLGALEENYVIKQTCEFWTQAERRKAGPPHNALNEVSGGSISSGWALCSLLTICLMTEPGPPSAPALPNEPQREITGFIVARHRSLALISPNKPVSSQAWTHPSRHQPRTATNTATATAAATAATTLRHRTLLLAPLPALIMTSG